MPVTVIDPKPALIIVDLQKGLLNAPTKPLPMAEVIDQAARLARTFRANDLPVVLVNVEGSPPGRSEFGHSSAARPQGWADLVDGLDAQPSDIRVTKNGWNAFHDTGLSTILRGLGVTQVLLAGVATSVGVEGTARGALDYGYHVVLATDAMTDVDTDAHVNSVERIFPKLGETGTVSHILALIDGRPSA